MNIYELQQSYIELMEMLEAGEVTEEEIKDTLDSIDDAIEIKANYIGKLIKEYKRTADDIKAEMDRLKARQESAENNRKRLIDYMQIVLNQRGEKKLKTTNFTYYTTSRESVQIDDETLVPDEYCVFKRTPVKTEIKKLLKSGEEVPFAKLVKNETLCIR